MAREYCLMCTTCKEFMDLHKFPVPPYLLNVSTGMHGIIISPSDLDEAIKNSKIEMTHAAHLWVFKLIPYVHDFLKTHAGHDISMVDHSACDYYWWPEHEGYTDWMEIKTNLDNELFLPRNLIHDLKITDWINAEKYLQSLKIMLYEELEINEYRRKFNQLIEALE
jgi:hypothetical protein